MAAKKSAEASARVSTLKGEDAHEDRSGSTEVLAKIKPADMPKGAIAEATAKDLRQKASAVVRSKLEHAEALKRQRQLNDKIDEAKEKGAGGGEAAIKKYGPEIVRAQREAKILSAAIKEDMDEILRLILDPQGKFWPEQSDGSDDGED